MANPLVINVVSGKGGTGKTLFTAVLAEMLGNQGTSTLVVDLDIFVRGLTALLYFRKHEALMLTEENQLSVSDFFIRKKETSRSSKTAEIGISHYRAFDVLPSVPRVDQLLNFRDMMPDSFEEAVDVLKAMLACIPNTYKVIILDSRAGYDELIAATHTISNLTISVEEDDVISRVTAETLVTQLKKDAATPLFRVINKARNIRSEKDLERENRGVTDLGLIPFDIDVMNSFGTQNFWEDISRSLYKSALARVWNRLSGKLRLGSELNIVRISPVAFESLEKKIGFLSLRDRVFYIYGIFIAVIGIMVGLFGTDVLVSMSKDPIRLVTFLMGIVGIIMALWVTAKLGRER